MKFTENLVTSTLIIAFATRSRKCNKGF